MKVRILVSQPEGALLHGEPWPAAGTEITLPASAAAHLVACEVAEEVTEESRPRGRKSRKAADGE